MPFKLDSQGPTDVNLIPCPWCETDKNLIAGHNDCTSFTVYCTRCHSHGPVFNYDSVSDEEGVLLDEFVDMVKDSYHDLDDFLIQRAIDCWNGEKAQMDKVDEIVGKRIEVPFKGELETGILEHHTANGGLKVQTDKDSPSGGNTIWVYPKTGQVKIFQDAEEKK